MSAVLEIDSLHKHFVTSRGTIRAVDGISFQLNKREIIGVVGESGSGKSSLAKTIVGIHRATSGSVKVGGRAFTPSPHREMLRWRRQVQMVFQDPFGSLNPRLSIGRILTEPFVVHGLGTPSERMMWASELLAQVGLSDEALTRNAHEFSGGQRQRICIARALALKPSTIICDEAVSALDVSMQAQIINLLLDLQQSANLSYLFISHDLGVIHYIADRIMVMYLGEVVELGPATELWASPLHPYTMRLLAAVGPSRQTTRAGNDEIPSQLNPPSGCRFHPRCPFATDHCRIDKPVLRQFRDGRWVACHYAGDIG